MDTIIVLWGTKLWCEKFKRFIFAYKVLNPETFRKKGKFKKLNEYS